MSRIDEALQRASSVKAESAPRGTQPAFAPAWTVTDQPAPEQGEYNLSVPAGNGALSFSEQWRERVAFGADGDPGLIEQFRRLAATLHHAHLANGLRTVMVTSSSPGEGKTLTAVNLAIVLAESYRYSVLLVDADLRRPSIPNVVEMADGAGLSEALRSSVQQKLALVTLTPRLKLLPAGQPIANSIEALTSPRMRTILDEAKQRFDWVVVDAPPIGAAADARLLAGMVEGTLFVINAGRSQHDDVVRSLDSLGRDQVLGVVLNGVENVPDDYDYYSPREQGTR